MAGGRGLQEGIEASLVGSASPASSVSEAPVIFGGSTVKKVLPSPKISAKILFFFRF
jgi:hypothetical protein